jgi:choline-sulfatase
MNVLVLMCDQVRYDALECHGNPYVHTPNLNRLAAKSVRFENAFTQSPACAPARHSLATGKYPSGHGVLSNHDNPSGDLFTVAHALQPLNYRRFQVGNMHWKGDFDSGYEPLTSSKIDLSLLSEQAVKVREWESLSMTQRRTAGPSPRKKDEYWGYQVAQQSIRQLTEAVEKGEPFLSWTTFFEPHPPFYPPTEYYARRDQSLLPLPEQMPEAAPAPCDYILKKRQDWSHLTSVEKRQMIAGYYGLLELADEYVGMVLDAVDRLGIADDTMIIFTSDHGEQLGDHDLFMKFVLREGSVHVPLMIYHPKLQPGSRKQLVELIDLFPTICDLTGAKIPNDIHGRSLRPLLEDEQTPEDWRTAVLCQFGTHTMIRTDEWKLNVYDGQPGELYDLQQDPQEFFNLIGEPKQTGLIEQLGNLIGDKLTTQ